MPLTRNRTLVRDLMLVGVSTCPPETPVTDVARLMLEKNLDTLIIILRHLAACIEKDLRGIGVEATRQSPIDAFTQRRDTARRRILSNKEE